ncbi:MAG: LacI family DNA-binding transcriptional regulator [Anaerolineae bacterium]
MAVTLKDIARELNLSVTTVSRALYGYDDVAQQTRQRVWSAAAEMGYVPDTTAQRLRKGRTDTLGFVIPTFGPRFSDPFFTEFLAGIGNQASDLGFDLLVSTRAPGPQEQAAYRRLVEGRLVDGLILVRTRRHDERVQYLSGRQFPFVAFGRTDLDAPYACVDTDGTAGFRQLVEYLIGLGHRRMACLSADPELTFVSHRLAGFHAALAEHHLAIDPDLIVRSDLTQRGGYEAASSLLDRTPRPTALVCLNDLMALGAMRAAQERGLVVGRDISITGFDDIPPAENSHPPLTTLEQPVYDIGKRLCAMLVRLIRGEPLDEAQVLLKPTLVVRDSSGPVV